MVPMEARPYRRVERISLPIDSNNTMKASKRDMYVCLCMEVTDTEIKKLIIQGARTLEDIGDSCGAGTCCGSCHGHVQDILDCELRKTVTKKLK
jgi:bacterioferritin-associated ferredoxin